MYSVFSVNLDIGPHTASVTSKITENSLVTDICQSKFSVYLLVSNVSVAQW